MAMEHRLQPLSIEVRSRLRSGVTITSVSQCVEELILNAVDAGATCVAVRLDMSCCKIQVVDNGHGMHPSDLEKIADRYTTSKCHTLQDLDENLQHYGYRGEALASIRDIAAILEVQSRPKLSTISHNRIFQKGKALPISECKIQRPSTGSTVTIHDLFNRLPVRKKCLNDPLEVEKVRQRIEGLALIHPRISFSFRNDVTGSKLLQTHKASSLLGTFTHLYGTAKARNMCPVSAEVSSFKVDGYIGKDGHHNKNLQFIFVNERLVLKTKLHRMINFFLSRSFVVKKRQDNDCSPRIGAGISSSPQRTYSERHGIYVLNITCKLSNYDITFDPSKTLIEFKEWRRLTVLVEKMVREFLVKEGLVNSKYETEGSPDIDGILQRGLDDEGEGEMDQDEPKKGELNDVGKALDSLRKYAVGIHTVNSTNNLTSETVCRSKGLNPEKIVEEIVAEKALEEKEKIDSEDKDFPTCLNLDPYKTKSPSDSNTESVRFSCASGEKTPNNEEELSSEEHNKLVSSSSECLGPNSSEEPSDNWEKSDDGDENISSKEKASDIESKSVLSPPSLSRLLATTEEETESADDQVRTRIRDKTFISLESGASEGYATPLQNHSISGITPLMRIKENLRKQSKDSSSIQLPDTNCNADVSDRERKKDSDGKLPDRADVMIQGTSNGSVMDTSETRITKIELTHQRGTHYTSLFHHRTYIRQSSTERNEPKASISLGDSKQKDESGGSKATDKSKLEKVALTGLKRIRKTLEMRQKLSEFASSSKKALPVPDISKETSDRKKSTDKSLTNEDPSHKSLHLEKSSAPSDKCICYRHKSNAPSEPIDSFENRNSMKLKRVSSEALNLESSVNHGSVRHPKVSFALPSTSGNSHMSDFHCDHMEPSSSGHNIRKVHSENSLCPDVTMRPGKRLKASVSGMREVPLAAKLSRMSKGTSRYDQYGEEKVFSLVDMVLENTRKALATKVSDEETSQYVVEKNNDDLNPSVSNFHRRTLATSQFPNCEECTNYRVKEPRKHVVFNHSEEEEIERTANISETGTNTIEDGIFTGNEDNSDTYRRKLFDKPFPLITTPSTKSAFTSLKKAILPWTSDTLESMKGKLTNNDTVENLLECAAPGTESIVDINGTSGRTLPNVSVNVVETDKEGEKLEERIGTLLPLRSQYDGADTFDIGSTEEMQKGSYVHQHMDYSIEFQPLEGSMSEKSVNDGNPRSDCASPDSSKLPKNSQVSPRFLSPMDCEELNSTQSFEIKETQGFQVQYESTEAFSPVKEKGNDTSVVLSESQSDDQSESCSMLSNNNSTVKRTKPPKSEVNISNADTQRSETQIGENKDKKSPGTGASLQTSSGEPFTSSSPERTIFTGTSWVCKIDTKTGRKMFINNVTGHSSYDDPSENNQEIGEKLAGLRFKNPMLPKGATPLLHAESSPLQPRYNREQALSTETRNSNRESSLSNLLADHQRDQRLEEDEERHIKWRSGSYDGPAGVSDMFSDWENPVFKGENQSSVRLEASSSAKGALQVQQAIHPYKFTKDIFSTIKVLGQVDNKFIACSMMVDGAETGGPQLILAVIDQHAAHERVRLERLTAEAFTKDGICKVRTDLEPALKLVVKEEYVRILSAFKDRLEKIGLSITSNDTQRDTIMVHSIPSCLSERDVYVKKKVTNKVVVELVEILLKEQAEVFLETNGACGTIPHLICRCLNSQACHGAIKFGDYLTKAECEKLIKELSECQLPFQCAHGRPSIMPILNLKHLQQQFPPTQNARPQLWKILCQMKNEKVELSE